MNYETLPKTISAEELLSTPLPPVKWIIPDLLPAGLALFAGPSKAGKSWLTLWLCLQVAQGKPMWGREIEPHTVLYLSLEDTFNRLQKRLLQLVGSEEAPERLVMQTECSSIGQGLEEQLVSFIYQHPDTGLIVIDTLQKVRSSDQNNSMYASDYKEISALKALADKYNVCILLIHHLRKQAADDPFQQIAGSNGLMGASDTSWVMQRKRMSQTASILVTGRDMDNKTLRLHEENCVWILDEEESTEQIVAKAVPGYIWKVADYIDSVGTWQGTATELLSAADMPMVAGRLQEKNGFYYIVLSYTDSAGKRRQPWIGTGLPVKGNKKRAEKMLAETRKDFTIPKGQVSELSPDMAFSDYMRYWLKMMRTAVTETTYSSYCFNVEKHIIPYFEPLGVTLAGLQPRQIQSFYLHEAETLKNTSILRFHANLHKALKYAVRIDLIPSNPVDKVDRPKPQTFMASYYSAEEMEKLFEAAQGHKLELIIQLAAFYGLRRAEVMGLRWEAIDFEAKTLTIRHIVTSTRIDGKKILVEADRAKTKSSLRTLPLVDPIAERLKAVKEQQEYNQKICGNCYNQEYLGYVFVDAMGNLIQPDSVTTGFPQLLKENGLRRIRFHDLRHSCASLLLKEGVPMKQIQEWLGHSDISTTANIYAHLDSQSKNLSARTMANTLTLPKAQPIKKW